MTLPASGTISMSQVSVELGRASTATTSLGETAVRTLAGVPSGAISMSNLYGKSNSYAIEYLVVAGGGGAAGTIGGAGGAGGYRTGSATVNVGTAFTATVGGGGAAGVGAGDASKGTNSSFNSLTSTGGGAGINSSNSATANGGSGGGGSYAYTYAYGTGTAGQGNNGTAGYFRRFGSYPASYVAYAGGSGGGAGAAGTPPGTGSYAPPANGGNGSTWSNGVTYAGGGASCAYDYDEYYGSVFYSASGTGGSGGGGNANFGGTGFSGTANRGGGGGCGDPGGSGGSGVVIIRYAGSQRGTGGTVTSAGGYTYHTFTSSGTFTA